MYVFVLLLSVVAASASSNLNSKTILTKQNPIDSPVVIVDDLGNALIINPLAPITRQATRNDITYYIYTRDKDADIVPAPDFQNQLTTTQFNQNLETYFVTHGWNSNYLSLAALTNAILQFYNVNVIAVDWSPAAADPTYVNARAAVNPIGGFIGDDINFMMDTLNYPTSYVNLAGHSLGAHVCGAAGAKTSGRVFTVVGEDPAGPLFETSDASNRLDPTDGQFVHVIHTNGNCAGFMDPLGHADYYPNGGSMQPGCGLNCSCSHGRSEQYFVESMNSAQIFTAHRCDNYFDYSDNKCFSNPTSRLGQFDVDRTASGKYYLKTNFASPFAMG